MSVHPLITSSHTHTTTHTHPLSLVQVCMCVCASVIGLVDLTSSLYMVPCSQSLSPPVNIHKPWSITMMTHTHKISIQQYTFIVLAVWQGNSHLITLPLQSSAEVLPLVSLRPLFTSHHCSTIRWMLLLNRDSQVVKHMERSVSYENILTVESDAHIHPPNSNPLCISFQSTSRAFFHENPNIFPLHSQWKLGNWIIREQIRGE